MAVKLFILGLPGSGKSTISRHIVDYVQQHKHWSTERVNDYEILLGMFHEDIEHKEFRPTEHGGFDVLHLSVLDTALKNIENEATRLTRTAEIPRLIVIEFARNDYSHAFKQFSPDFLQDGYFLFLNAQIETCKQRIRERVAHPKTKDDHYVSEHIFESYYKHDSRRYLTPELKADNEIDDHRIMVLENNGLFQDIIEEIDQFVDVIFEEGVG